MLFLVKLCDHSCTVINIKINLSYDSILHTFVFKHTRIKVKVTVAALRKKKLSLL